VLPLNLALQPASCKDAGVRPIRLEVPVLVVILIVIVILAIVAWLARSIVRARSSARIIGETVGQAEELFHGGIMSKHLTTSGSLVRLEMYDWGIRIRGTVIARWIVPTWEARYDELAIAELVASPFSRIGVWLRLREEQGGMGFLSNYSQPILRNLAAHEVPVNRAVARIRRFDDLEGPSR
jgi:uncharacterized membrane protein YeaQ/YmgE (transglycosylase-associated protein family)